MAAADQTLVLKLSRRFDASPERVFDAWLSPEWGAWLPPANATCEIVSHEPVVGGHYVVLMTMPDGRKSEISGTYRVIERPNRIAFTWIGQANKKR
jgi:uncharacterized protein YndB with AHSA1/START domain